MDARVVKKELLSENTEKMNVIKKKQKKALFVLKYVLYQFTFWFGQKRKKIKLDLPKNYGASQYIKRLPYIRYEDTNFQILIINILNDRSNIWKFLLATRNYGRNKQENINAVDADGKLNQAVVRRALDQKHKGVFESPIETMQKRKNEFLEKIVNLS